MNFKTPEARLYATYLKENPDERDLLIRKAKMMRAFRDRLHEDDYIEVATPVLCHARESAPIPQFSTTDLFTGQHYFLRHSAEDHLRRLAIAVDRVYDLGKVVRVEHEDSYRTVEFLMLQAAARNVDLNEGVTLIKEIVQHSVFVAYGTLMTPGVDWTNIHVRPVDEVIAEVLKADRLMNDEELAAEAHAWLIGNDHGASNSDWEVMEDFMKYAVEPVLVDPTMLIGFPYALRHSSRIDPTAGRAQRFSLIANGIEVCDGGLKLRHAADYRPMVDTNIELRTKLFGITGDQGPIDFYADIGTEPADVFSFGLGVDRLIALCADRNVHEVLTFPFH